MKVGREEMLLAGRLVDGVERLATANEKLIYLATEEREQNLPPSGPPVCPHCGRINPTIRAEGAGGPMADYILVAYCSHCSKRFFAVPIGWQITTNPDELLEGAGR